MNEYFFVCTFSVDPISVNYTNFFAFTAVEKHNEYQNKIEF